MIIKKIDFTTHHSLNRRSFLNIQKIFLGAFVRLITVGSITTSLVGPTYAFSEENTVQRMAPFKAAGLDASISTALANADIPHTSYEADQALAFIKAGIPLQEMIELIKTGVWSSSAPKAANLLKAGIPPQDVFRFISIGKDEYDPSQIAAAATFIREGISASDAVAVNTLSPEDLSFAQQHSSELKDFASSFTLRDAVRLMKADITPSQIPQARKLVDALSKLYTQQGTSNYSERMNYTVMLLKGGVTTMREVNDAIAFIKRGIDPETAASLVKGRVKTSQATDVLDLLKLGVPSTEILDLMKSGEGPRILTKRAFQETGIEDLTPDQINVVLNSPNKMIMAQLIDKKVINIHNPTDVRAAREIVEKDLETFKHDTPSYDQLNQGLLMSKNDRHHFAHFNEKGEGIEGHISTLWHEGVPNSLNTLRARLAHLSDDEGITTDAQTALAKSHVITAKNAAQSFLNINPFGINQGFRTEHILNLQKLADHMDALADGLPQSDEEAEDLHIKATALRVWVKAVIKSRRTPHS